jgi:cyclic pyranopterin phosphate synthase
MNLLVDRFGRTHTYLRISVTDRCNLRCVYCMPAEGVAVRDKQEFLSFEEIERLAGIFVEMGINKIRITGGEPLVRRNLELLLQRLSALQGLETLAITTNAVLLAEKVEALRAAGVNALNISLDSLQPDRFREITLRDDFARVIRGLESAVELGFDSIKLNVVVMRGKNDDEILDFVDYVREKPVNVRFIEFMPFPHNAWCSDGVVSYREMRAVVESRYRITPLCANAGDVAKDFALDGYPGTVSFITSMTDSFCSSCNRLRLTADGSLKSCLFYAPELSLRDAMRAGVADEALRQLILSALQQKPESHPPMEELASAANRSMVEIGG